MKEYAMSRNIARVVAIYGKEIVQYCIAELSQNR